MAVHPAGVITMQPIAARQQQWMQLPPTVAGCPPGLEYLTMIDQILCHKVPLNEVCTDWNTDNKYVIANSMGQRIYYASEETNALQRMFFGEKREFTMQIINNFNQEVLKVQRPSKLCAGYNCCAGFDCCAHELSVEAPVGVSIGSVRQLPTGCVLEFAIRDAAGETQLIIDGPCLMCRYCADAEYPVYTKDKQARIGCVTNLRSGLSDTRTEQFGITFPMNLDVKRKATLIGAMFLVDFMVYEGK